MNMKTEHNPAQAHQDWIKDRQTELEAPEGWLSLVGLHWLEPDRNGVGSAAEQAVALPSGPAQLGHIVLAGEQLFWRPTKPTGWSLESAGALTSEGQEIFSDRNGKPSVLRVGDLSLHVIERDGRMAVRVRDRAWAEREPFHGLEYFPFDPAWQIDARWERLENPVWLEIPSMTGGLKQIECAYQAVFEFEGREFSLLPLEVETESAFFVFRDQTSGKETYGGGRFLRTPLPVDGRLLLDFNRAYNPPCAFSPFATCPLPPPENRLPIRVEAGERRYGKG